MGNEGAGTVVAAGTHVADLLGRVVACVGGGLWTRYRLLPAASCLVLAAGTSARDAASAFVNPMPALGLVETARRDGHTALVHTAAASNLGQMLLHLCLADGVDLVNVVRSEEQVDLLRAQGAAYVCNTAAGDFEDRLREAVSATGATVAFAAVGGGPLTGRILRAMEAALTRRATTYSPYGSPVRKQVHVYGRFDPSPRRDRGQLTGRSGHWSGGERAVPKEAGTMDLRQLECSSQSSTRPRSPGPPGSRGCRNRPCPLR